MEKKSKTHKMPRGGNNVLRAISTDIARLSKLKFGSTTSNKPVRHPSQKSNTPTKYRPYVGKEKDFQKSVARYLDSLGVLWNHTGNERKTASKQNKKGDWYSPEGAIMKQMGVKKGFPDIMIYEHGADNGLQFNGFAIELKVGKGRPSTEQLAWHTGLRGEGWKVGVYYSLDHVIADVKKYLSA